MIVLTTFTIEDSNARRIISKNSRKRFELSKFDWKGSKYGAYFYFYNVYFLANARFDHLLESYHRNDSKKLSYIEFWWRHNGSRVGEVIYAPYLLNKYTCFRQYFRLHYLITSSTSKTTMLSLYTRILYWTIFQPWQFVHARYIVCSFSVFYKLFY